MEALPLCHRALQIPKPASPLTDRDANLDGLGTL